MRSLGVALVSLLVANAFLAYFGRVLSVRRAELVATAAELAREQERAHLDADERRALEDLLANAKGIESDPRSIGELRDVLLAMERDLPVRRLSLDFRPERQLPDGFGGSRVHATLRGSFDAIYDYLARIENLRLALAPESLTLRGDEGEITVTLRWASRWPTRPRAGAGALSAEGVALLNAWLLRAPPPRRGRDIFSYHDEAPPEPAEQNVHAIQPVEESTPPARDAGAGSEIPVLAGFVLARPELEPDVRRRVLAAVRFGGSVRLVMVGDRLGDYVVERVEARDSVTLKRSDTGERIRLTLD